MAAKGHVTIFCIIGSNESCFFTLETFYESFTTNCWMILEIIYGEPMYPQYSGVLQTCLALRYWFFEVLGSESVNHTQLEKCVLKLDI